MPVISTPASIAPLSRNNFLCKNMCLMHEQSGKGKVRNSSNSAITILLYILGIGLVITAALLVFKGTGLISAIPETIIWAIALFSIGAGILAGIGSLRR